MSPTRPDKHDVFVSYAHVDNQVVPGADEGWVTSLVARLRVELAEQLGRSDAAAMWMDPRLPGNESLKDEILGQARGATCFLMVLSSGYLSSSWCRAEFAAFVDANKHSPANKSRVFVVERSNIGVEDRPGELQDVSGYRFWHEDDLGNPRALSATVPVFRENLYHQQVRKLAFELASALKKSQAVPAAATGEANLAFEPLPDDMRAAEVSSALFAGVGTFDQRSYLPSLRFAPDDAVSLAHLFALELRIVAPERTCVALGGQPRSTRCNRMLEALRKAKVRVTQATRTELLYGLEDVARLARDQRGVGVIAFSTHALAAEGSLYLMPSDGSRRFVAETGLGLDRVLSMIEKTGAARRLLILDTCRASDEEVSRGDRAANAMLQGKVPSDSGTAILASCSAGQLSWESPELEQGIFTHFLLDGLRGGATSVRADGFITLDDVMTHTIQRTADWVRNTIKEEQLPWGAGDRGLYQLPLSVSAEAKRHGELEQRRSRTEQERKERALGHLLAARQHPRNRAVLSAAVQLGVEHELEALSGESREELLEMLERLADGKESSCRLFSLWWNDQHVARAQVEAPPAANARWTNSLGIVFVPVAGVHFGQFPVRVQDFRTFVAESGHDATGGLFSRIDGQWVQTANNWSSPGYPQSATHPVAGVSWEDADAFCKWLTARERRARILATSQSYRLPTDAEWSAAAGDSRYPWGDGWPPPPDAGRYGFDAQEGTSPVCSHAANAQGIFDLGGNVWEWCDGWYSKAMNPPDLREQFKFLDDDSGGNHDRFMRGASWFNMDEPQLRADYRNTGKVPNVRFSNVGFRCVIGSMAGGRDPFHP